MVSEDRDNASDRPTKEVLDTKNKIITLKLLLNWQRRIIDGLLVRHRHVRILGKKCEGVLFNLQSEVSGPKLSQRQLITVLQGDLPHSDKAHLEPGRFLIAFDGLSWQVHPKSFDLKVLGQGLGLGCPTLDRNYRLRISNLLQPLHLFTKEVNLIVQRGDNPTYIVDPVEQRMGYSVEYKYKAKKRQRWVERELTSTMVFAA
ncbi:hypothetical protein B296_00019026 [Ensete ventricosum]|uniref:Uncharacterized protein n=1 Tax=Ensete ventricosum TaxID=4639 RepID=A0A426ZID4_ENSVE|nr:hypothetical protein B296_00019026 [Ensete ventricosum]